MSCIHLVIEQTHLIEQSILSVDQYTLIEQSILSVDQYTLIEFTSLYCETLSRPHHVSKQLLNV